MNPTEEETTGRHLSAVLHADMFDSSAVTLRSDAVSRRCVVAIREAFADIVPKHEGWFRAKAGDAVLALFPSAVGAVTSAIEIQQRLARVREQFPDLPVWLRIGAHMGEVTPLGDDWHGDSLNTTARIQAESDPGGLMISSEVCRAIRNVMNVTVEDVGLRDLKGVGRFHLFKVIIGTELLEHQPWSGKLVLYRRQLAGGVVALTVAALVGRKLLDGAIEIIRPDEATTTPSTLPGQAQWPLAIAVMEISPTKDDDVLVSMCGFTHQGLNALLSKFEKLKVFSKDMIDWKKEKTGKPLFEIAKDLNVTKMINGAFFRSGGQVTLQVRIVDTDTGLQQATCQASGTEDQLVAIQNDVGMQIVQALKVPVTKAEVDRVMTARTNVDLDVTKRYADAFGGTDDDAPPKGPPGARWFGWPPAAYAAGTADEEGVKQLLERYRTALEAKNLKELANIYANLADNTRDALDHYFQNASDLKVQFSGITVLFEGDEALATFTRSDKFKDVQTGRDVNLEVRVSTVVAKQGDAWKIKALRKPS